MDTSIKGSTCRCVAVVVSTSGGGGGGGGVLELPELNAGYATVVIMQREMTTLEQGLP